MPRIRFRTVFLSKERVLLDCCGNPKLRDTFCRYHKISQVSYPNTDVYLSHVYLNGSMSECEIKNCFDYPTHFKGRLIKEKKRIAQIEYTDKDLCET